MKYCKRIGLLIFLLLETSMIQSQHVGLGNTDPKTKLDVYETTLANIGTAIFGKIRDYVHEYN
ncbi:MAG: hypothetical protein IPF52_19560 [Saprospiraceae bacterium]|nr:hypothetical protein [Saprospiraceae bacterium]